MVNKFHTQMNNGGLTAAMPRTKKRESSAQFRGLRAILKKCFRNSEQFTDQQNLPALRVLKGNAANL
jgi:hypothetical protein